MERFFCCGDFWAAGSPCSLPLPSFFLQYSLQACASGGGKKDGVEKGGREGGERDVGKGCFLGFQPCLWRAAVAAVLVWAARSLLF